MASCNIVSFIRARDPSILISSNKTNLKNIRINLAEKQSLETSETIEEPESDNLKIYLRVKYIPETENEPKLYEIKDNMIYCKTPTGSQFIRNAKNGNIVTRKYNFTHIFGPHATQDDLFNTLIKNKVFKFINGENSTLLTYGASGSGKTYTIVGTEDDPGIIPRALEYIFRSLPKLPDLPTVKPNSARDVSFLSDDSRKIEKEIRNELLNICSSTIDKQNINVYKSMQKKLSTEPVAILEELDGVSMGIWVSFAEIYNEHIYDLLKLDLPKGKARPNLTLGSCYGHTYIKNLSYVNVSSGVEAYQILQYGLHNLKYASTALNPHSSRSHSIFTIKLAQMIEGGSFHVSYINFCDLAGSERLKKTTHVGERLREANNINTSLMVLGRCISYIRDAQKKNDVRIVPFRESKLTWLFQRALSGLEDIAMIVNINPIQNMFDETLHVLNFSAIAKDIMVEQKHEKIVRPKSTAYTDNQQMYEKDDELQRLRKAIVDLYNEIERRDQEYIETEEKSRHRIQQDYERLIDFLKKNWNDRLDLINEMHKEELQTLKADLCNNVCSEAKRPKIINLDSSCDDDSAEGQSNSTYIELNKKINTLQAEVTKCKFEIQAKNEKIDNLLQENSHLNKKVLELENILRGDEEKYFTMSQEYKEKIRRLEIENIKLNDLNVQLQMQHANEFTT